MIHVVCLEGCHGVGKTSLWKKLTQYMRIGEEFKKSQTSFMFSRQAFFPQMSWVMHWFEHLESVLRAYWSQDQQKFVSVKPVVVVTDRSPYSAEIYTEQEPELLNRLIQKLMGIYTDCGIDFHIIKLVRDKEDVWRDVVTRVSKSGSVRMQLKENNRDHFDRVWKKYEEALFPASTAKIQTSDEFTAHLVKHIPCQLDV